MSLNVFPFVLAMIAMPIIARTETNSLDGDEFLVSRALPSTQASDPFMLAGRLMDESQPRWHEFKDTLGAFPDTSSCLRSEEREKETQNLLAFDWKDACGAFGRHVRESLAPAEAGYPFAGRGKEG
jgi:hypothetical protein